MDTEPLPKMNENKAYKWAKKRLIVIHDEELKFFTKAYWMLTRSYQGQCMIRQSSGPRQ